MKDEPIEVNILFVGLTRPTTVLGIPYIAFVVELSVSMMFFLMADNLLYLSIIFPLHAVLYAISARDAGQFDEIYKWIITSGRCLNFRYWGSVSFSPNYFSIKKSKKGE
jgi:type IV secretion system protein VirB3